MRVKTLWLKHSDDSTTSAQLIACHNASMECYRRAMIGEQTFEGYRENLTQANKLSRTYAVLLDALDRHRGKGQQTASACRKLFHKACCFEKMFQRSLDTYSVRCGHLHWGCNIAAKFDAGDYPSVTLEIRHELAAVGERDPRVAQPNVIFAHRH
jgi:hypothetical protein